jgi:hypothetical protein
LAILKDGAGTKWDTTCVAAFERILPKIPPPADSVKASGELLLCLGGHCQGGIVLEPGPPGGARMRWIKPGVDISKYHRLMLDPVVFFFASDSEYKGMDPQELKSLADAFRRQLIDSLKKRYPIVTGTGPDVARIRFAITDLRQSRPVDSDGAPDEPTGPDGDDLKKRALTSWAGSGATCAEVMMFDSMTREAVFAAKDERTIGLREKFTRWGSVEDAFEFWANRVRLFLDQAHARNDGRSRGTSEEGVDKRGGRKDPDTHTAEKKTSGR